MAGAFFTTWQTWEKLVFILACALVLVVLLGCVKLLYSHRKLRKYTTLSREDNPGQVQPALNQNLGEDEGDVPFGIRALESGIEVEGIWISRTNTPEVISRPASGVANLVLHGGANSGVGKQMFEGDSGRYSTDTSLSSRAPVVREREGQPQGDVLANRRPNYALSSDIAAPKARRSRHPPPSLFKYDLVIHHSRAHSSVSSEDGSYYPSSATHAIPHSTRKSETADDRSILQRSISDCDGNDSILASAPLLFPVQPRLQREASSDLDLMQLHRLSQVAEIGQFTPRARRLDAKSESASMVSFSRPASSKGEADHSTPVYAHLPTSKERISSAKSAPPNNFAQLPPHLDVAPFTSFDHSAFPLPPSGEYVTLGVGNMGCAGLNKELGITDSCENTNLTSPEPAHHTSKDTHAQERSSFKVTGLKVARGQGSGFEILQPGSFNAAPIRPLPKELEQVEVQDNHEERKPRTRPHSAEGARRLQKQRRSSQASSKSSETGTSNRHGFLQYLKRQRDNGS